MSAQIVQLPRFGATVEEWQHFDLLLGLTPDLLPVVSNPKAEISAASKMKQLGKTPSRYNAERKVGGIANWTQHASTPADVAKWMREPDYGICLQTRVVRALDVDIEDDVFAAELHVAIDKLLGLELPTRRRIGSGKFLLALRVGGSGGITKRILRTAHGAIEFLATGQQFIAAGTHPSGERYQWVGGLPERIPTISLNDFERLWSSLESNYAVEPSHADQRSTKAAHLAGAIHNDPVAVALVDRGLVLSSERDGRLHVVCPFASEHTSESAESATTYFPANTGGYARGHWHCLHAHCAHRTDEEFNLALSVGESVADDFKVVAPSGGEVVPGAAPKPRFTLEHAAAFAERPQGAQIIRDVWPAAELVVVYGESTSGKSFLTLDQLCAVARGVDWRGKKTIQGRGVYVCAEGAGGFQKRLKAYAQASGIALADLDVFILGDAPNLMLVPDVKALIAAIKSVGPVAVVAVDTLAQTMVGGEENSAQDMGKVVAHCKAIHKHTGATVVLIHHSGKDATKGARGSSALRAATDAEIEVVRMEHDRVATVTKLKDGADGAEFGFKLQVLTVGVDDEGEDITSCVIEHTAHAARGSKRRDPKGTNEKAVMRAVRDCMGLAGEPPMVNDVIEAAVAMLTAPEDGRRDKRREHIVRALDKLVADGALEPGEGGVIELAA